MNKSNQLCEIVRQFEDTSVLTYVASHSQRGYKIALEHHSLARHASPNHIFQECLRHQAQNCRPHTSGNIHGRKGQESQVFYDAVVAETAAEASEQWAPKRGVILDFSACTRSKEKSGASSSPLYFLARAVVVPSSAKHHRQFKSHLKSSRESTSQPAGGIPVRRSVRGNEPGTLTTARTNEFNCNLYCSFARQYHKRFMRFSEASLHLGQKPSSAKRATTNPIFDHCTAHLATTDPQPFLQ